MPKIDFVRANRRRRRTRRSKIRVCTAGITLFEFSRLNVHIHRTGAVSRNDAFVVSFVVKSNFREGISVKRNYMAF